MLSCIRRPTITYNLAALAEDSLVSVGRETDAHVQLDSLDIPCLLSRKHANLVLQPGGTFTVVDLGSTNGTFAARQSQPLRKLPPGYPWELQHGDTIGFGGPETIIVKRAQVGNPFLFMYYNSTTCQEVPCPPHHPAVLDSTNGTPKASRHAEHLKGQPSTNATQARSRLATHYATDEVMADSSMHAQRDQLPQPQPLHCQSPHSARAKENWGSATCTPRSQKKVADSMHSHLTCPVCCDTLLATHMLHCGHMFCGTCLATWMTQNQSCPSCRKIITGVPVRCFTIDNMISDLLTSQHMSPGVCMERKRKQEHWDNIQRVVVQDWVTVLQRRRETALQEAARNNTALQNQGPGTAGAPGTETGRVVQSAGALSASFPAPTDPLLTTIVAPDVTVGQPEAGLPVAHAGTIPGLMHRLSRT